MTRRFALAMTLLFAVLLLVVVFALSSGYQPLSWSDLRTDETARTIFFRLRVPRVFP